VSLGGRRVSVRQPPMRTADDVARGAGAGQEAFCSTELLGRESFIVIVRDTPEPSQRTRGSSLTPDRPLGDIKVRVLTDRKENVTAPATGSHLRGRA